MLFAFSFGEGFLYIICMGALGVWSMRRLFGQFDSKGAVTDAARNGIIRGIGRLFK
jgi:hypothetical protein